MADRILQLLIELRVETRRVTLLSSLAVAGGIVLLPAAYRGGLERTDRWLLLCASAAYLLLASYRLLGGFQVERQYDLEERFVRRAAVEDQPIEAAHSAIKIGRLSCLVQGIRRAVDDGPEPGDLGRLLRRALRSSTRLLLHPPVRFAIPVLIALAGLWMSIAVATPSLRGLSLYAVVIPALAGLCTLEAALIFKRRPVMRDVGNVVDHVAEWVESASHNGQPNAFRHRILYRDVVDEAGLA